MPKGIQCSFKPSFHSMNIQNNALFVVRAFVSKCPLQERSLSMVSLKTAGYCIAALLLICTGVSSFAQPIQRTHPYLYFTAETIAAIRAKVQTEPFASRWSRFLSSADGHLSRATYGFDNTREALGVAGICAFAYAITGQTNYADRAKQEAAALFAASQWHTGYSWNRGADLETAEASVAVALVYDWCYDRLSAQEREVFKTNILQKSSSVYLGSIETHNDWWVNNPVTNWCGVVHGGCGLAALALYDEDPQFQQAADYAFDHLESFLDTVILEDGGGHEGIMYNRYGVTFGNYFFTAAAHVFGDDRGLPQRTADKRAGYWYLYMYGSDSRYANFNNMNENTFKGLYGADHRKWEGGPCAALCGLWESQAGGDPALLWGADMGGAAFYWKGVSPFWILWRRDTAPAGELPELQNAVLFRGAGQAIFNEPRLWFAYNGGWTSNRSHHNNDLGTFILVADNDRLVHDPGYGDSETGMHSTILVNGFGQPENVRGTYLHFGSGSNFHYLASDLSNCYNGELTRFVRHAVMVNGSYMVLLDDLAAPGAPEFEWRLQTRHAFSHSDNIAHIHGESHNLFVTAAAPSDAVLSKDSASIAFLRITPATSEPEQTFVTVLFPTIPAVAPPDVKWVENGTLIVNNDTIAFSGGPGSRQLASINGEQAADIDNVDNRTLLSLRQGSRVRRSSREGVTPAPHPITWNITGNELLVETGSKNNVRLSVMGFDGRIMHSGRNFSSSTAKIDIGTFSSGVFLVIVEDLAENHRSVIKIVR
ncbi:MAG: DUF4962 domain-containing protein [Chitinivibrionales bacterium]|nr:DUF4962 domain-containing protein [Chitinivibrionales bacterium]